MRPSLEDHITNVYIGMDGQRLLSKQQIPSWFSKDELPEVDLSKHVWVYVSAQKGC